MADNTRSVSEMLGIGLKGRCPHCAEGKLFDGFLTVVDKCKTCGQDLSQHDIGDGPAVFGTFFVGALGLAVGFLVEIAYMPPLWVHPLVTAPVILGGSVGVLRPLKGISVAMQYRFRSVDEVDENLGQM